MAGIYTTRDFFQGLPAFGDARGDQGLEKENGRISKPWKSARCVTPQLLV
jgi:hypothetical protein